MVAAAAFVMSGAAASATTLDFTGDDYTFAAGAATGTFFTDRTWTVTSSPAGSLTRTPYDGASGATGGLDEIYDGFGVVDDEVSEGDVEYIHIEFSKITRVTGLHFLDLFVPETALVWFGKTATGAADAMIAGVESFPGTGYLFADISSLNFVGKYLTFGVKPSPDNDPAGVADYAVAGIEVVPLPAAGWLLLGGIGGLVAMKRRKKA